MRRDFRTELGVGTANLRRHVQAWSNSQFLHGEQGALVCTAKIVQQVPSIDSKFYAATQVIDEARHVETYSRLLHEKFELAYPITPTLKRLLNDVLSDSRWDMTYLGMQVLIEGLALAAFAGIRDTAKNPLAAAVNAYVMQDEARHVAFGRLALRDFYPQLSDAERDEREEFTVEAC
jgi:1,2-phenylacetyl-CoA epoxidase catalytic subunit